MNAKDKHKERGKEWIRKMVEHCASKDMKTFQVFLRNETARVFASVSPRPSSDNAGAELPKESALSLIQSVFALTHDHVPGTHFTSSHFWQTDIQRNVVGPYGLHVGIVSNGPDRWILTVTATLTTEEVQKVKEACAESHYESTDELLEDAKRKGFLDA